MTKLIYLHIPKSGGTSERSLLFDLYGRQNVFWHGAAQQELSTATTGYDSKALGGFTVIGGHKPLVYYPQNLPALYLSAIREPISRVVSLYSYYTRPQFAGDYHESAREEALSNWRRLGIDTKSLVNSINNCQKFREEVENYQCRYLSRYDHTFEGVLRTLVETEAVICDLDSIPAMNALLSDLLGWGSVPVRQLNFSRENTHRIIYEEPGLAETISPLIREDQLLYDFIREKHNGLYKPPALGQKTYESLIPVNQFNDSQQDPQLWKKVVVFSKGFISIGEDGTGSTGIVVINNSNQIIDRTRFPDLAIYYTLHNKHGKLISPDVTRQPLEAPIDARGKLVWNLKVAVPKDMLEAAVFIQAGLSLQDSELATDHNPLHPASAYILHHQESSEKKFSAL